MITATAPNASFLARSRVVGITGLVAAAVFAFVVVGTPDTARAASVAINQCNAEETGAAREIGCDIEVVNNLDVATGLTSSTVTTTVCVGAPGAPVCGAPLVTSSTDIVGSVNQCNGSVNSGGSTVFCNVSVVNNITGVGSTSPATVNQCIGSAAGGTPICAPTSSVTGADITQCNGSGNGLTLVHFECTVTTSTVSSLWPVVINQCNSSANGGGSSVTCTAHITTTLLAPVVATTTTSPSGATTTTPATATTAAAAASPGVPATTLAPGATIPPAAPSGSTVGTTPGTPAPTGITVPGDLIWLPETL